jgi:hypothetical protein
MLDEEAAVFEGRRTTGFLKTPALVVVFDAEVVRGLGSGVVPEFNPISCFRVVGVEEAFRRKSIVAFSTYPEIQKGNHSAPLWVILQMSHEQ